MPRSKELDEGLTRYRVRVWDTVTGTYLDTFVLEVPRGLALPSVVRRLKVRLGWTGLRCMREVAEEYMILTPHNASFYAEVYIE